MRVYRCVVKDGPDKGSVYHVEKRDFYGKTRYSVDSNRYRWSNTAREALHVAIANGWFFETQPHGERMLIWRCVISDHEKT
jgi:hypothetical protein